MPIYEYVCKDCGTHFDALRSMKEADSPITCNRCHSENAIRKVSACFAKSGDHAVAGSHSGCGGCSGGSCASCHH